MNFISTKTSCRALTYLCAFCLLTFTGAVRNYAAEEQAAASNGARQFLLSDELFSEFYGNNPEDLIRFDASNESLALPFETDADAPRASFDAPFNVDCSVFDSFELVIDIDKPSPVSFISLYFHSKAGWYHSSSASKHTLSNGCDAYVFDAKDFGTEDTPAGWDQIDAVRISFWRGQNVDAQVKFHSFRASRLSYAIVEADDQGGENHSIVSSFDALIGNCGFKAERLDGTTVTVEDLKRYSVVFLPISGSVLPQTTDALCEYIDAGGFVFACYNVPEKLMKKIGVVQSGYVKCATKGISLSGMTFDQASVQQAASKGFTLPSKIEQKSWNFFVVGVDPEFTTDRKSTLFGDSKARVLANWTLESGEPTEFPALIASPNGVYCSHIYASGATDSQRAYFESFIASLNPSVTKKVAKNKWVSVFKVGLEPESDLAESYQRTLNNLEQGLKERGWTLDDAARIMRATDGAQFDRMEATKFISDLSEVKTALVESYYATCKSRENEGRLWWEHSGCGIYPGDWDRTMKELSEAGFNGVVPNMLWGGNAYYKSDVLPIDPKVEKYGDQIELAVAAGKKYGVEVHAWMVCFNASNSPKWFIDKMREEGRLQHTITGEEKPWLCPSHPSNQALELAALEEVATKYDVDGVHFDYIRFPDDKTCYCDGCQERFAQWYKETTGKEIGAFPECVRREGEIQTAFRQWRCDQITGFVRAVHDSLKAKRPEIKLSAAVFSGYPGTKKSIGQDWGLWVDEGLLDFVCPMDYTNDPNAFACYVQRQLPYTQGKVPLYPGIGMTATGISMSPEEVVLQAELAKKYGAQGFTIFNLTKTTADKALPALKQGTTSKPTKAPHQK